jgi:hypothetical protein
MPDTATGTNWLAGVVPDAQPEEAPRPAATGRDPADAPGLPLNDGPSTPRQEPVGRPEDGPEPVRRPDPAAAPEPESQPRKQFAGAVLAVVAHFFGMAAEDRADRKARGNGRWWWMRWMGEQPASVQDHLYYYLHERFTRRDGRKGWDLDTASPLLNWLFATFVYRAYGLTVGLVLGCLLPYALGWLNQRPARSLLTLALCVFVERNVVSWLLATVCKS